MRPHEHAELDAPDGLLSLGSRGWKVQQVQEWLCLHGFRVAVDCRFGPATQEALKEFQWSVDAAPPASDGKPVDFGYLSERWWAILTEPLRQVVAWTRQQWPKRTTGEAIVDCARAYLAAHPREVGKPNGGPWVRHLCRGQEVAWCAGFATTVLGQALGHDDWYTLDCDDLASNAMSRGLFRHWKDGVDGIRPGDLFLIRRDHNDWIHTGIVTKVEAECFHTIEGNTNDDGSREGHEVAARIRAFNQGTDFVLTGRTA